MRWRTAAALLVGCDVLVGCLPAPTPWVGEGRRVAVVGDSQVTFAEEGGPVPPTEPIPSLLVPALNERGFAVSISTEIGATTTDLGDLEPWPEPGPEVLVIALGTNDLREGGEAQISASQALANLDAHTASWPDACLVLVTVVETSPWGLDVNAPAYNDGLAQRADVLVDWAAVVQAVPSLVGEDGVHPTDGGAAYRQAIVDGASNCT